MAIDTVTLQKLQRTEIAILDEVVRICKQHNLQYFLTGGTLLGAIRHEGFIPWDDDIDIGMPRRDYEKFLRLCESELSDNYYLLSPETYPAYWTFFSKICKKNTFLFEENTRNYKGAEHRGIYIDIFPYDYTSNSCFFLKLKEFFINKLHGLILIKRGVVFSKNKFVFLKEIVSKIFSFKALHNAVKRTMTSIPGNGKYIITWCGKYGYKKEKFPSHIYFPLSSAKFDLSVYSVPKNPEYYLRQIYGDYMQLPPEEQRQAHSIELLVFDTTQENLKV